MSLREQIEAKRRRTARLPVLVGDPSSAAAEVAELRKQLARLDPGDKAGESRIRADLEAVAARQAELVAWVGLQSLPDDEWDEVVGPLQPSDGGLPDLTPVLPVLLAASCVDVELQDGEWWSQQLKRPEWTDGDKAAMQAKLFELNVYAPSGDLGKG